MLDGMLSTFSWAAHFSSARCCFCQPPANPFLICGTIVRGLHVPLFSCLPPFVTAGRNWLLCVLMVFFVALVPALYLARWTAKDRRLGLRAAPLAFGVEWMAFLPLPSVVMRAMSGGGEDLPTTLPVLVIAAAILRRSSRWDWRACKYSRCGKRNGDPPRSDGPARPRRDLRL